MGLQMCWYGYTRIQSSRWKIKMLTRCHLNILKFEWIPDDKHSTLVAPGGGRGGYSKTVKPLLSGHLQNLSKCPLNRGCALNRGCKNCAVFVNDQYFNGYSVL